MKKVLLGILALIACMGAILSTPTSVFATKCTCTSSGLEGVPTSILGEPGVDENGNSVNCKCDDGNGSSIMDILYLVIDIMSVGIGILGVIGISIVGVQYLTAGGNEEKTRKAKRRMFEIILGLAVYVVIYAILKWLLPGFNQ